MDEEPVGAHEDALADEADELFARWLESRDGGTPTTLEELSGGRAELLAALRSLATLWQRFEAAGGVEAALQASASASFAPDEAATPASERYAVGREVGRGGMGVVFEVTDSQLHRRVAMKVVRSGGGAAGDRRLTRFLDEAQVTAQLEHPGIVPVHELGRDDEGRAYFTMALVEGETLTRVIERLHAKDPDWSLARALDVVAKVGDAVAYAHSRGVVHRDLKPDNVMVGRYGQVYVMDWGLARVASKRDGSEKGDASDTLRSPGAAGLATDQPLLTHDGDVVGTPAYMPPEQAFGQVDEQGPRCDVYAIGAILHHVLCGSPPYADRPEGVLVALRHGAPTPLLAIDARLPRELVAIAELAMRRDPARRYPDVAALTMDLRAYLEGRVVGAFESGTLAQARKWVLRHRALTGLALAVLVVAAIAFASRLAQARVETLAERFMMLEELDDLERDAQELWPVAPERRADFERYIARGERLASLLPELRAEVEGLASDAAVESADDERRTRAWIEDKLRQTLVRLEHFAEGERGTLAHVRDRLARAAAIERVRSVHTLTEGDLLPLGVDRHSGLALFEHLASAAVVRLVELEHSAARDFVARAPGQGIVFVRLPNGVLFGRDEVTLSQWSRLSDDMRRGDSPVTDIAWIDALETLERSGLTLPDQRQWLDAVEGGSEGSFGFDVPPNASAEVLSELLLEREVLSRPDAVLEAPAEVGSRLPNRFGLFDTIGNVGEFLIDPFYAANGPSPDRWREERGLTRCATTGFYRMRPEIEGDRELLLTFAEVSEAESGHYYGVRAIVAR